MRKDEAPYPTRLRYEAGRVRDAPRECHVSVRGLADISRYEIRCPFPLSTNATMMHKPNTTTEPVLFPLLQRITEDDVTSACGDRSPVFVCDFYVEGAERWEHIAGGWRSQALVNIDHHAPVRRMEQRITSTMLAAEYVAAHGAPDRSHPVVIHHLDCDSMLSSAIMLGRVAPAPELLQASQCADHTGEANPIADLLQALDEPREGNRTIDDYRASYRAFVRLLAGLPPEADVAEALAARLRRRDQAARLVESGRMNRCGPVAWIHLDEETDGAMFVPLVPDAAVLLVISAHPAIPDHFIVKTRLGNAAADGTSLHRLGIDAFDPAFGGRWNAGSNRRGHGTALSPAVYAERFAEHVGDLLAVTPSGTT